MQTTYLQSLIANNARQISFRAAMMNVMLADAKKYKADGEVAFSVDAYKKADKLRTKVAKLVNLQRTLKAELKAAYTGIRLDRKHAEFFAATGLELITEGKTTFEVEAILDMLLADDKK